MKINKLFKRLITHTISLKEAYIISFVTLTHMIYYKSRKQIIWTIKGAELYNLNL